MGDGMRVSVGDLVDRLCITNLRIWHLEEDVRAGKEGQLGLEEVGRRALAIRDLNKERVALKNALNEVLDGEAFRELKVKHASASYSTVFDPPLPVPQFDTRSVSINDVLLVNSADPYDPYKVSK